MIGTHVWKLGTLLHFYELFTKLLTVSITLVKANYFIFILFKL